jgi:REP element-mobilizing transposase RayT
MGREKRIWYPGAEYHVMNRGNRRGDIFRTQQDYEVYLMLVAKAKKRYPFELLSYCLMTNHVHLQIRTIDIELYRIIQYIHFNYSRYFNETYNLIGHLFQGRYTAQIIEEDEYSLITSRYIHLNPVKANMVALPIEYQWSSYETILEDKQSKFVELNRNLILNHFNKERERSYQKFVEEESPNKDEKYTEIATTIEDEEILCQQ